MPTRPTGTLEHTNWTAYTHARGAHHILGLVLDTFSTLLSQSWWGRSGSCFFALPLEFIRVFTALGAVRRVRLTTFHSVTEHDSTAGTSDGGNDRLYNRRRVLVNMRSFLARRAGAFGPPVACSRCCRGRPQGRLRGRRPERPELRRSPVKRLLPCVEARPRRRVRADESSESLRMYRAHTKKRERRSLRESGDRVRPVIFCVFLVNSNASVFILYEI